MIDKLAEIKKALDLTDCAAIRIDENEYHITHEVFESNRKALFMAAALQQEQSSAGQEKGAVQRAIENIQKAVRINDTDTLSMLAPDSKVIWTASGSWSGSASVTLGDLRAIGTPVVNQAEREGVDSRIGYNFGHGHAWRRPDGMRARCGGPGLCNECSKDLAAVNLLNSTDNGRGND